MEDRGREADASEVVAGMGLRTGSPARVRFVREPGPVRLRRPSGPSFDLAALVADGAARSTSIASADGRLRIGTVEHLFAALGALSIHEGLVIEVDGPELPLLDGGARAFHRAVEPLGIPPARPPLTVARDATILVGASRYELRVSSARRVDVALDFDDARLAREASWAGDARDFCDRIAPARTFGFASEIEVLLAKGLASHVAPESVVVIGPEQIWSAGRPFDSDEPARHKLLDLVGDLYAHGGPPVGFVRAWRPGHAATHEAVRQALTSGALVRA